MIIYDFQMLIVWYKIRNAFFVFLLLNPNLVFAFKSTCSIKDVVKVPRCPKGKKNWFMAAAKKGCNSKIAPCTSATPLLYHCVENHWGNTTYEMCAQNASIIGYSCPEYNERGQIIQSNSNKTCKGSCPFKFNSSDVFQYQQCFSYWNSDISPTPMKTTPKANTTTNNTETTDFGYFQWFLVPFIFCVIIVIFGIVVQLRKRGGIELPVTTEEIKNPMMKTE